MKIYQWSKIYTRYDKSINCEQQTHIFFLGNCYGRKMSHSIKTDVRICEAWIHMRHLNEEQKGVDFHKKNIAGIHHKIPWLFPDFLPFKDFPWLFTEFPDFSLTLKNKNFPWLFPDRWQPCHNTVKTRTTRMPACVLRIPPILEFCNNLYTQDTFWNCLIRCANMKWIQLVLWKIQSGQDFVHRRTDRWTDGQTDGRHKTSIPPFQLRWSGGYNNNL